MGQVEELPQLSSKEGGQGRGGLSVGYPGWVRRPRRKGRRIGLGRVKKDVRNC